METNGQRVLVAEDDRFLRRACEMSPRQLGYTVPLAKDGEEALTLINIDRPDLILLDLLMPKVTGLEVLRALKSSAATRSIPVLILTNSSRAQDVEEIRSLGADVLPRPLQRPDLWLDSRCVRTPSSPTQLPGGTSILPTTMRSASRCKSAPLAGSALS
jgi:CheY-like chemotaxis protein